MKRFDKNIFAVCFAWIVVGLFCACSNDHSVAGTAEEPNQIADEEISSSSQIPGQAGNDNEQLSSSNVVLSSSSDVVLSSSQNPLMSSSSFDDVPSSSSEVILSSSSDVILSSSQNQLSSSSETPPGSNTDNQPQVTPPGNAERPRTLDNFIKQYGYHSDIKFDDMVLAYNLVYEKQCGGASDDCVDEPMEYQNFRRPGVHSDLTDLTADAMAALFPKTVDFLAKTPNADEEYCPFYLLNIDPSDAGAGYPSDAGFVLSNITEDKLTVVVLRSRTCESDDKSRVFGTLFRYCGKLSSNLEIEYIELDEIFTMECRPPNSIDVSSEWVNKNLL